MELVGEGTVNRFPKIFVQTAITRCGNYWLAAENNFFYVESEFDETVAALATQALRDSSVIYGFMQTALEKAERLNEFSGKAVAGGSDGLAGEPDDALIARLNEFAERYTEMYAYATSAPMLGYKQDNALYAGMNEILKKKTGGSGAKQSAYLLVLTRPLEKLATQKQDERVLALAAKAVRRKLSSAEAVAAAFPKEISALRREFEWLSFDLCDSVAWNEKHYASLVAEKAGLGEEKIGVQQASLANYEAEARRAFDSACAELKLSEGERRVFEVVRDIGYYKWAREHEFQQALFRIKRVQDELGRRAGLSTLASKYVLCGEWPEVLSQSSQPGEWKAKTDERLKALLLLTRRGGGQGGKRRGGSTIVFEGERAIAEYSKIVFAVETASPMAAAGELKGLPACTGRARGRVSVINSLADVKKMKDGDVLVSVATTPDLVPFMKRAAAIITSEGGVTCHAAIVSRELRIPCVVGVRGVHKKLADGDVVEVDAIHGIVKKIS